MNDLFLLHVKIKESQDPQGDGIKVLGSKEVTLLTRVIESVSCLSGLRAPLPGFPFAGNHVEGRRSLYVHRTTLLVR